MIGINDAINGVFLPYGKDIATKAINHYYIHTDKYYRAVNTALEGKVTIEEVEKALRDIANQLLNGTFPH